MQYFAELPPLPMVEVRVEQDRSDGGQGFLWRRSRLIRIVAGGVDLGTLVYDEVDRAALDAVVVVPYFDAPGLSDPRTITWVVLRSAVRPPIALRDEARSPVPESERAGLWEVPAGLVEATENSPLGIRQAAQRELREETGFSVPLDVLQELGCPSYPAPGVVAERHFYFSVRVDPSTTQEPSLDGSPLEAAGRVIALPLAAALESARVGELADGKTELALRRLAERLGGARE
jgi:ADP-ribose pyrophosphatase